MWYKLEKAKSLSTFNLTDGHIPIRNFDCHGKPHSINADFELFTPSFELLEKMMGCVQDELDEFNKKTEQALIFMCRAYIDDAIVCGRITRRKLRKRGIKELVYGRQTGESTLKFIGVRQRNMFVTINGCKIPYEQLYQSFGHEIKKIKIK